MKVAITGHTGAVGRAVADAFRARGAEVVGLSSSNGYDPATHQDRIVEAAAACDVFVINAQQPDDSQLQLLFRLAKAWQGQDRTIINLGSSAAARSTSGPPDPSAVFSRALDAACQQLFNRADQRPRVVNIRPGEVDSDAAARTSSTLSPEDVARVVMWVVDQPRHVYVSSVTLARHVTQGR